MKCSYYFVNYSVKTLAAQHSDHIIKLELLLFIYKV